MAVLRLGSPRPSASRKRLTLERGHPFAQGLVAWWLVQPSDISGYLRWYDLVTQDPAVLVGLSVSNAASGWQPSSHLGGLGELRRDGSADHIAINNLFGTRLKGTVASILMWIRPTSISSTSAVFDTNTTGTTRQLYLDIQSTLTAGRVGAANNDGTPITWNPGWVVGAWQHLAMVVDGVNITTYLNGQQNGTVVGGIGTGFVAAEAGTPIQLRLGTNPSAGANAFQGAYDDVRLYNRAVQGNEIAAIYENSVEGYPGLLQRPRRIWSLTPSGTTLRAEPSQLEWQAALLSIPNEEGPGQPLLKYTRRPRLRDRLEPGQSVNLDHPLNANLVAWWLAQPWQIGGNTLYELVNQRHGLCESVVGGSDPKATLAPTTRTGGRGEVRFDAVGDVVYARNIFGTLVQGLTATVSAWIYPLAFGGSKSTLFDNNGTSAQRQIYFSIINGIACEVAIGSDAGDSIVCDPAWTIGEWQHLTLASDGSTIRVYRNGVLCSSSSSPTFFGAGFADIEWMFGNGSEGPTDNFLGYMDDIRLYSAALPFWQIQAIYQSSLLATHDLFRRPVRVLSLPGERTFGPMQPAKVQWQATTSHIFTPPVVVLQPEMRRLPQPRQRFLPGDSLRSNEPLALGLLYWWLAQPWEFPGRTWHDLLRGTPATLTNMPAVSDGQRGWTPATHPGGRGALGFDGSTTTALVETGEAPHNLAQLTLSAWINPRTFGTTGKARIIDNMGIAGLSGFFLGLITVEQKVEALEFNVAGNALLTATTTDNALSRGVWQHIAVVWDGGFGRANVTFYVNGMQVETSQSNGQDGSGPIAQEATHPLYLGNRDMLDRGFDGGLDDIRLYNRPLTAQDIFALYSDSLTGALRLLRRERTFIVIGQPNLVTPATSILLPARMQWQATTGVAFRSVQSIPSRIQWQASTLTRTLSLTYSLSPAQMKWQASTGSVAGGTPAPTFAGISRALVQTHWTHKPPMGTQIDAAHPLAQGLETCWLFNEGSGQVVYDATGHGHHVTVTDTAGSPTHVRWSGGRTRQGGLTFLSDAGTLALPGNIATPIRNPAEASLTVEFWLFPTRAGSGQALLQDASTKGFWFIDQSATTCKFLYEGAAAAYLSRHISYGQWHHIVCTFDSAQGPGAIRFTCYIDGFLEDVQSFTPAQSNHWVYFANTTFANDAFTGTADLVRTWTRSLTPDETLTLYHNPFGMFRRQPLFTFFQRASIPIQPAQMQWAAQATLRVPFVTILPGQMQWRVSQLIRLGTAQPAMVQWSAQATRFDRTIQAAPARVKWQANRQDTPAGLVLRDCGPEYDAALAKDFISGDWLIQAPALGLALSMDYDPDGTWEHRIVDISDIEISVPRGGGIASVANVTISVAEDGRGQSIVQLWEQASAVGAVQVTIDFLVRGATGVLRIFTGHIDSITVQDAVSRILLVDDSIRKNSLIPQVLTTVEAFTNADQAALAKPMPLVYGRGSRLGGAPMLFVDVSTNVYLVAAHPMTLGGKLAVFDQPTNTYLTLDTIIFIPNNATATITLGTLTTGALSATRWYAGSTNPQYAVDGNSGTLAKASTDLPDIFPPDGSVHPGNGYGFIVWTMDTPGQPRTNTFQFTVTNHRRSPGSTPVTTGQFYVRTVDGPNDGAVVTSYLVTQEFNHVTSAQTDVFTISNVTVGFNHYLEVVLIAACVGSAGNPAQTYEVGEVSFTPLVAFSANISTSPTAVGLPINTQELRFNRQQAVLSVHSATGVTNATFATDGNSMTIAQIGTTTINSNLDGYGELIVTTTPTSAQRANNTVVIDLINHRRALTSTPTVTGTFSIQSYNTNTGVLLRDNLFTTQQFRHQLNPITTSYTATAINLGAQAQLAVRVLAQNEGGAGSAGQVYEVGEIGMETFYQPRGDSADIYLYGDGYSGRMDPDGSVTGYADLGTGTVLEQPDMIMASMYIQELSMLINEEDFAAAYSFFANNQLFFDGGLGAGWAVEQTNVRNVLDDLARQSTSLLFPSFNARWTVRPYRTDQAASQSFTVANILTSDGSERQRPEDRGSTMQITLGNLQEVSNHFEVRYAYNPGARKYDRVFRADKNGSNLPASYVNKEAIEQLCAASNLRYGDLEQYVIDAYWIADDATAMYLLNHIVRYFSQVRTVLQFETTMVAACLQPGSFITVTYPTIPTADNGGLYEVHTIRYMPLRGRIQITCSKSSTTV